MKKFIIYLVAIALTVLVVLHSFSKAFEIGLVLRETNPWLEVIYYVVLIIVVFFLIIKPVVTILFAPYYSINRFVDDVSNNDNGIRKRAITLIKNKVLDKTDEEVLMSALNNKDKKVLSQRMNILYNNQIKKKIDDIVVSSARDTMFLTAVSQSSFIDSLLVLVNNFRMVKKIVVLCGFRPSFVRLSKLYINILASSLIAEGLQKIDISALISTSIQGTGKLLTNSSINGVVNAFFMLRTGMLARNYLYANDPKKDRISLKNSAFIEASKLIPSFISELFFGTVSSAINTVSKIFNTKEKKEKDLEEEEIKKIKYSSGNSKEEVIPEQIEENINVQENKKKGLFRRK